MAQQDQGPTTDGAAGGGKPTPGVPNKIEDILLPKKVARPLDSAARVNAGALLEQEQKATLQKPEGQKPAPVAQPKKEESLVKPLETYRGAIEQAVQHKNISVVSIAAQEAKRREQTPNSAPQPATKPHDLGFTIAAIAGGMLLLAGAAALLTFIFVGPQADAPVAPAVPPAAFIAVDDTQVITIPASQWQRDTLMSELVYARESTALSLGLIARLYVAVATSSDTLPPAASIGEFLGVIAPNVSGELLRSLSGQYTLGIHSFDGNQAFLILGVEGYEAAYAGMLEWELAMPNELSPLFMRSPRPRIPEENLAPPESSPVISFATTTATTTEETATSTATTSATSTPQPPQAVPDFFRTQFIDRIVENHDARAIQDENGDILLLWTFLDRSTLVITTNEYTLREIISRRARPPVITI